MNPPLSANAQAILLLTAPLIIGRNEGSTELLSPSEYNRLARALRDKQLQPGDLLAGNSRDLLSSLASLFLPSRLEELLGRGFLLSQAVERWTARSIWVVARADKDYPKRLKSRLKEDAPPILYGCGDPNLLNMGGIAVVGSREVNEELITYTEDIGRLAAKANRMIISGGAKGIDRAAMRGALATGGYVAGVLSDSLERAALARDNREPLIDGRLVFICPYDPAAGFNVGHAMQRNKLIYALADAGLVVNSDFGKGGTWAGAIEQLEKLRFVPVFVRNGPEANQGNAALIERGGQPWPNPTDPEAFLKTIEHPNPFSAVELKQESLSLFQRKSTALPVLDNSPKPITPPEGEDSISCATHTVAEQLFSAVKPIILQVLKEFRTESALAELLSVSKPQVKAWLAQLMSEGAIEKKSKPVRYRWISAESRLF